MKRDEILNTALEYVTQDRSNVHGPAEDIFGLIAAMWDPFVKAAIAQRGQLADYDVAAMMNVFKMARAVMNPGHADNWIDGAGYASCGGERATAVEDADDEVEVEAEAVTARLSQNLRDAVMTNAWSRRG